MESNADADERGATKPIDWRHELLRDTNAIAGIASDAEVSETHISWLFLTKTRVFKVKKSVRYSFLDYGTLEKRRLACDEEIRLNRRLAPNVYLGVRPIMRADDGTHRIGAASGHVVDYCVEMSRLPSDRMLDVLLRSNQATAQEAERIMDVLIPFYARAERGTDVDAWAEAHAIERNVRDNLAVLEVGGAMQTASVQRIRSSQLQFLILYRDIFQQRIREGRIREGHGDLRPEHVCMVDPPVVFDCVEFSRPLRCADVLSEIAFLAAECEVLGESNFGMHLLERFRVRSGDDFPDSLAGFYQAYRACVRAKVDLLRAQQLAGTHAEECLALAQRHLQVASFHANDFYRPLLVVMVGAAGTGKSTIACRLADVLGLQVLRSDVIRQGIAGRREPDADLESGMYSPSMTERTYATLLDAARRLLDDAVSVVLDGSFTSPSQRDLARRLAAECGVELCIVLCGCDEDTAAERIAQRSGAAQNVSDATPRVSDWQSNRLAGAPDLETDAVITLDTTQPLNVLIERVLAFLRRVRR